MSRTSRRSRSASVMQILVTMDSPIPSETYFLITSQPPTSRVTRKREPVFLEHHVDHLIRGQAAGRQDQAVGRDVGQAQVSLATERVVRIHDQNRIEMYRSAGSRCRSGHRAWNRPRNRLHRRGSSRVRRAPVHVVQVNEDAGMLAAKAHRAVTGSKCMMVDSPAAIRISPDSSEP